MPKYLLRLGGRTDPGTAGAVDDEDGVFKCGLLGDTVSTSRAAFSVVLMRRVVMIAIDGGGELERKVEL
jgi:hypothetical protein